MSDDFWDDADIVFRYTDKQAVDDGILMPVSFGEINLVTDGIVQMFSNKGIFSIDEFNRFMNEAARKLSEQRKRKSDWFYSMQIDSANYFIAENGSNGFTLMKPEEY
jgi:hypothetical protein